MTNRLLERTPVFYAISYGAVVLLYAVIYYMPFGLFEFDCKEKNLDPLESLYFSVVTITTLGYGDVTPIHWISQLLTASEALFGIVFIGLFLGALARTWSEQSLSRENERASMDYHKTQLAKLHGHYSLLSLTIENFERIAAAVTQPMECRKFEYDPNFKFQDMHDLFKPSGLSAYDDTKPTIELFFKHSNELQHGIEEFVKNVDLREFNKYELEGLCISIVNASRNFDYSDRILGNMSKRLGTGLVTEPYTEVIYKMIKNYEGEPEMKKSNPINGFIALDAQIRLQMQGVQQLKEFFPLYDEFS